MMEIHGTPIFWLATLDLVHPYREGSEKRWVIDQQGQAVQVGYMFGIASTMDENEVVIGVSPGDASSPGIVIWPLQHFGKKLEDLNAKA
jgi:hypothetical protein